MSSLIGLHWANKHTENEESDALKAWAKVFQFS